MQKQWSTFLLVGEKGIGRGIEIVVSAWMKEVSDSFSVFLRYM